MALVVLVLGAGLALIEIRQAESAMVGSARRLLERTFGAAVVLGGPIEARLLPRPRLLLAGVHLSQESAALRLDVPLVEATPTLASVLLGHATFEQIRLVEPTAAIDVDRLDSTAAGLDLMRRLLPNKVVVTSGVVALHSIHPAASGLVTDLDAVLEGIGRNGSAVLTGHADWRGQHTEVTARLEPFFDFVLGRTATASLRLHLPTLSAVVDGTLHAGIFGGFDGTIAASTPSLGALLRANGLPAAAGSLVNRVSVSATGLASPGAITFSNAHLTLDDTKLEGSLAWQPNGSQGGAWTGTLATDTLDLTGLLHGLAAWDRDGRWSDAKLSSDSALWGDIDLRVSAGQAVFGPVSLEDAALSALSRNGRVEVSLSEARASDGMIRGRAVATLKPADVDLKLDMSVAQLDLEPLGWGGAAGVASGHLTAAAHGASPRALVAGLTGHGQISVRQGAMPTLGAVADLSSVVTAPTVKAAWNRPAPFDLGTADLSITHGVMSLVDGRLVRESAEHRFTGQASLLDRTFSLAATEAPTDAPAGRNPGTSSLTGVWGQPLRVLHMDEIAAPVPLLPSAAGGTGLLR